MKAFDFRPGCYPSLILATIIGALCAPSLGIAENHSSNNGATSWAFHSTIPLGTDLLILQPSRQPVALMVSAESEEFKNWKLLEENNTRKIVDTKGHPVKKMPSHIAFRVTAGTKDKLSDTPAYPVATRSALNEFLLNLRFRIKIFRGIDTRIVQPEEVRLMGLPAEEPYDERIFRASFDLGDVNIDDRLVLEIFDGASEQRISKFHLEF